MNRIINKKIIIITILTIMLMSIASPVFAVTSKITKSSIISSFFNIITEGTKTTFKLGSNLLDILLNLKTTTGEEDQETKVIDINSSSNTSFLEVAKERHDYIKTNKFTYKQGTTVPADASKSKKIDCSAYVCDVLYHYGYTEFSGHQKTTSYFMNKSNMKAKGWTVVSATKAQAGDIVVRSGHMEIYAGDGNFYNAGSTEAIRKEYSNCGIKYLSKFTYAIRVTPPTN